MYKTNFFLLYLALNNLFIFFSIFFIFLIFCLFFFFSCDSIRARQSYLFIIICIIYLEVEKWLEKIFFFIHFESNSDPKQNQLHWISSVVLSVILLWVCWIAIALREREKNCICINLVNHSGAQSMYVSDQRFSFDTF